MSTVTPVSLSPLTATPPHGVVAMTPMFKNAAEWLHALGDVPLERIVFDPWPGTATEEDLIRMNDVEDRPVELIDGTLVEKAVGNYESMLAAISSAAILNFVLPRKLGDVTGEARMKHVRPGNVRMPDVCLTNFNKYPGGKVGRESITSSIPDLIVEVLSKSNTRREIEFKLNEFFKSGTRLAWVVDLRKEIVEVHHKPGTPDAVFDDTGILDGENVLPGFMLPLHDLFHTYD